jgi:hypothetical protein
LDLDTLRLDMTGLNARVGGLERYVDLTGKQDRRLPFDEGSSPALPDRESTPLPVTDRLFDIDKTVVEKRESKIRAGLCGSGDNDRDIDQQRECEPREYFEHCDCRLCRVHVAWSCREAVATIENAS